MKSQILLEVVNMNGITLWRIDGTARINSNTLFLYRTGIEIVL